MPVHSQPLQTAGLDFLFQDAESGSDSDSELEDDYIQVREDLNAEKQHLRPDKRSKRFGIGRLGRLSEVLASRGQSIDSRTEQQYKAIANRFRAWLIFYQCIEESNEKWAEEPSSEMPKFICAFLMDLCDSINFWDGSDKPADELRSGLTSADKIRAALSFLFGIICGLGTREWKVDPHTGLASGNPSLSPVVARYMVALKKRKALSGETPESARAITPAIMKQLYMFNRRSYASIDAGGSDCWTARLLQCAYTIANLCLLRFDEVLRIRMQDIRYVVDGPDGGYFLLTLPTRKTFKFGRVPPFPLWPLESDEAHMCPYRALCEWLSTTGHRTGYLFPKLTSDHRQMACMGETPKDHMSSSVFLEMFRINLLQIGVDYSPYGTHSFRRGGCQYLIVDRRWNIRRVCEWGGWSTTYSHLTIVKYIISVADEPMSSRADFFRPGGWVSRLCRACGRSCPCNS